MSVSLRRHAGRAGRRHTTANAVGVRDRAPALGQFPVFQRLDPGDVEELARSSTVRRYENGARIEYRATSGLHVLAVVSGGMQVYRLSCTGNKVTIGTLCAGGIFGLSSAVIAVASRSLLEATENGTLIYHVPGQLFRSALARHPQAALEAIDLLGQQLSSMCDQVEDLALYDVKTRLGHALAKHARTEKDGVVRMTHGDLAAEIGTRQDEVTKILRHFREDGLIMTLPHRTGIALVDPARLESDE